MEYMPPELPCLALDLSTRTPTVAQGPSGGRGPSLALRGQQGIELQDERHSYARLYTSYQSLAPQRMAVPRILGLTSCMAVVRQHFWNLMRAFIHRRLSVRVRYARVGHRMRGTLHLVSCWVRGGTYLTCANLKKANAAKRSCSTDRGNTVLVICADNKHPTQCPQYHRAQHHQLRLMLQ